MGLYMSWQLYDDLSVGVKVQIKSNADVYQKNKGYMRTNLSTAAKHLNNRLLSVPGSPCPLVIYGFSLGSAVKAVFSSPLFFSCLSPEDLTEKERIQQSAECCRKILNHVNDEVKEMENLLVRNTHSITQHTVVWWLSTNWSLVNSLWDVCPLSDLFSLSPEFEGLPAQTGHIGAQAQ